MNLLNHRFSDSRVRLDQYNNLIINPQTGSYVDGYNQYGYNLETGWFNPAVAHQNSLSGYISDVPLILGTSNCPYPDEDYPSIGYGMDDYHDYRRLQRIEPPRYKDDGTRYRDAVYNDGNYYYTDTGEIQSPEYEAKKRGIPIPLVYQQRYNNNYSNYYNNYYNTFIMPQQPSYSYDTGYTSYVAACRKDFQAHKQREWNNYVLQRKFEKNFYNSMLKANGITPNPNMLNNIFTPWEPFVATESDSDNKLLEPEYVNIEAPKNGVVRIIKNKEVLCSGKIKERKILKSQYERENYFLYQLRFRLGIPTYMQVINRYFLRNYPYTTFWREEFSDDTGLAEFMNHCGEKLYEYDCRKRLAERRNLRNKIYRPDSFSALIAQQNANHQMSNKEFVSDYTVYETPDLDDMDLSEFRNQLQTNLREVRKQRERAFYEKIKSMANKNGEGEAIIPYGECEY